MAAERPLRVLPTATTFKVATTMHRFSVRALLVQNRGDDELLGIITDRDVLSRAQEADIGAQDLMSSDFIVGSERWPLEQCLRRMADARQCHLPIVGMGGKVNALLSKHDICRALVRSLIEGVRPAEPATVGDVCMAAESPSICRVVPNETVLGAVERMRSCRTTSVVVGGAHSGMVEGLFTRRDFITALASSGGRSWLKAPVSEHLAPTSQVVHVEPSCPVFEAFTLLAQKDASHAIVVGAHLPQASPEASSAVLGVISMGELLRYVLDYA